jgi:hypothetical protein
MGEYGLLLVLSTGPTTSTKNNHNETTVCDEADDDDKTASLADLEPNGNVKGGPFSANTYQGLTTVQSGMLSGTSRDIWSSSLGSVDVH